MSEELTRPVDEPASLSDALTLQPTEANAAVGQPTPPPMLIWRRGESVDQAEAERRVRRAHRLSRLDGAGISAALANLVAGGWLRQIVLDGNRAYQRVEVDPVPVGEKKAPGSSFTLRCTEGYDRPKRIQLPSGEWVQTLEIEHIPTRYFNHHTGEEIPKPAWIP